MSIGIKISDSMIDHSSKTQQVIGTYNRIQEIKTTSKFARQCPQCGELITFGIEQQDLEAQKNFPFPHVILHGNPIHCLIVYVDANFKVRGTESASSIEITRDQATFGQLIKKWSNPF